MTARGKFRPPTATAPLGMGQFLAHAYTLEVEAWERYEDLADQMDVHHNREVAKLFRMLGEFERKHGQEIRAHMDREGYDLSGHGVLSWPDPESPEVVDFADVHYRMTPYHALQLALKAEQRAQEFFATVARTATDQPVRQLAGAYADEEAMHVVMVRELLAKQQPPADDWDDDPDPAADQE